MHARSLFAHSSAMIFTMILSVFSMTGCGSMAGLVGKKSSSQSTATTPINSGDATASQHKDSKACPVKSDEDDDKDADDDSDDKKTADEKGNKNKNKDAEAEPALTDDSGKAKEHCDSAEQESTGDED